MYLQQVRYLKFVLLLVLLTESSGGKPTPKSLQSLRLPSKWGVVKCFQLEGKCKPWCKKDEVEIYGVGGCPNTCCVKRKKESMCETFCGGQCEADCSRQAGTELIGTRLCMDKKKTQCCVRQNEKPQCNNGETKGFNKSSVYKRDTRKRCGVYGGQPVELEGGWHSRVIRIRNADRWIPQYQTTYYCRRGYVQNGTNAVAQCRVDTGYYWTTPEITCTRVFKPSIHKRETRDKCSWGGKPPDVEGAWYGRIERIQNANFWILMEQYQVTYHCKAGLAQIGTNPVSQCTFATKYYWSKPDIKCIRKCPKPPTIANAVASGPALTASNIVEGEKVRYSCKAGFAQTSGSQVRTCSNGAWSGKNIVCKQTCPKPPTSATSVATGAPVTASQIVEGDRVTYVCKPGYYGAVDHVHMTCLRGSWRGRVLDCQPRKCRAPPTETTFYFSPIKTVYNSGERIVQSCRSGYTRTGGEAVRTCELGTWKPENGSISCERACPTPAKLSGTALVQTTRGKPTEYTEGMSVKYHCLVGYGKVGGDDTRTCTAGRWSGDDILCKRTCPTPADLLGAALVPSPDGTAAVYTEGMSVKYHCLVGYGKVGGDATRTCTAGQWSGDDILCKRTCIAPPAIPNTSSSHGPFMYFYMEGEAIFYLCQPGFAQIDGDAIRTCRSGTWTGTDINCDKICQPPPRLENGRLLGNLTAVYTIGDKANYTCVPGYTSNGPISVLCGEDGKWTNLDAKTCKRTCPTPPTFPHATLTLPQASQTHVESAIAVYSCSLGYMNSGTAPVVIKTCTNGKWSGGTLDCKQDTCPTPPKIPNAVAGQTPTSHGSTVQYTCLPGHTNLGNATTMSCVYGEWKMAGTMTCTKACPDPPKLTGAHITSAARKFYLEGHNVTYQCERGYQSTTYPETVHTKMCTNSVWKGTDFTCKRVCQSPPDVKNAVVTPPPPPFFEGTAVQYTCIPGLVAVNRTALKTCVGGNWTGDDIDCQKVCAQLPYVENTNVIMNHVPGGRLIEGARVIHRCQTGYTQVGGNSLRVCHDSSWTGKDIQCEKSCQASPAIRNTELADTSSTYRHGTQVRYQCVNGTLKVGGSETKQCVSGNWSTPDDLHCEKPCSRPPHFPLSRRVLLKVGPYVPEHYVQGNKVKYECRPGYENINTGDIKTCEDGRWVGADVNCQKLTTATTVTTVTTTEKPIPTTETKEPFAGGTKPTPTPNIIDPVEPGSGDAEKDDNLGLVEEIL